MASRDLAGLLTGISGAQRPNPNMGSDEWRMAFGAQQAQNLGNAVGNVPTMFGGERSVNPQEAIQIGMGKLDQGNIEDLKTLARMQQMRGDLEGAARTAAKIQAMQAAGPAAAEELRRYNIFPRFLLTPLVYLINMMGLNRLYLKGAKMLLKKELRY